MEEVDKYAKIIWDYMLMHQKLEKADLILVLGSKDLSPAKRAVELYFQEYASIILFSGNHGQNPTLAKPEAEIYRDIAISMGVPENHIYIENKSTNTGENVDFSKKLIQEKNIKADKIILVQKPYMERRTFATFKKRWLEPVILVTSPQISYENYTNQNDYDDKERIINRMVGDLIRIKEYPKLGFQIEQEIPEEVWQAGQELIKMGYNKYILK